MVHRSRALRSSIWVLGGSLTSQFIRLCSNIILAHLLVPEMFGLMTLVNVFIYSMAMLSDLGIQANIIQNPNAERDDFLRTAFTLQMIRGFVLFILCVVFAYPFAHFYQKPILQALIPVAGVSLIIMGFTSPKLYVLRRHVLLAKETIIEVLAYIFSVAIMIVIAWKTGSIWALVIGSILGHITRTVMSYPLTGSKFFRPAINREAAGQIIHFGKWILLSSAVGLFATQSDRLLFGKLMSLSEFGVFSIAYMLVNTISLFVSRLSARIIFPVLASRFRSHRSQYVNMILKVRRQILSLSIPIILLMFLLSERFIDLFYPSDYQRAGMIVLHLIPWLWGNLLLMTLGPALLAAGDSKSTALAQGVQFIVTVVGILFGFNFFGLSGGLLGMAFGPLAGYLVAQNTLEGKERILSQSIRYSMTFGMILALIQIIKSLMTHRIGGYEDLFVVTTSLVILIVIGMKVGRLFKGKSTGLNLEKDS